MEKIKNVINTEVLNENEIQIK